MNTAQFLLETEVQAKQIIRGKVLIIHDNGSILVVCEGEKSGEALCDVLHTSEGPGVCLASGDAVLVWLADDDDERGVIIGRIGPSHAPAPSPEELPEDLVIEAKNNLTFKCGEGSITLRSDGKVLIKGKDLVSRAQRMNRIKGGAVAIN
jgi:hypothetical protein